MLKEVNTPQKDVNVNIEMAKINGISNSPENENKHSEEADQPTDRHLINQNDQKQDKDKVDPSPIDVKKKRMQEALKNKLK